MCEGYILEWLDDLVTVSLNPAKNDFQAMQTVDSIKIKSKIEEEKRKIQTFLKSTVFSLSDRGKIELLIKQYHSGLLILLDQALENQRKCPAEVVEFKQLTNEVVCCVDELLSFIEVRFLDYLSANERVPATYLSVTKNELKQKLDELKTNWQGKIPASDKPIVDTLTQILYSFVGYSKDEHLFIFREIFYIKELCKELELLCFTKDESNIYTALDQLLIYLNFNSRRYIDNLTQRLTEKINSCENISSKMEMLLFHFKAFKQLPYKPGVIFDTKSEHLNIEISNWFTQEIFYLEKKLNYSIVQLNGSLGKVINNKSNDAKKIVCNLSVDQMGIVLRSLDDLRILMARSLNSVFKSIVPYLSTPHQENISYDSMRSKSYAIEARDKEMVIETLEQMIKKIMEY